MTSWRGKPTGIVHSMCDPMRAAQLSVIDR